LTQNEKFQIKRRAALRRFLDIPALPVKLALAVVFLAGLIYVAGKQVEINAFMEHVELYSPIMGAILSHASLAYLLAGGVALAALMVYPFGKREAKDQLQSIGLVNNAGLVPELLHRRRDGDNPRLTVWEFRNQSVPLKAWEDKRAAIEAALNITIVKIKYGEDKSRVLIYAVPAQADLPEVLRWKDSVLSPDNFVLVLGESLLGPVTVNLANIPHILLGGSTGSGKSVLLKLLLMQAVKKGAVVCIADFKGGVDFPPVWREKCRMCFEEKELQYAGYADLGPGKPQGPVCGGRVSQPGRIHQGHGGQTAPLYLRLRRGGGDAGQDGPEQGG